MEEKILHIVEKIKQNFPDTKIITLELNKLPEKNLVEDIQKVLPNSSLNISLNKNLVSGFRIQIDDKIFDSSIDSALEKMNQSLKGSTKSSKNSEIDIIDEVFEDLNNFEFDAKFEEQGEITEVRDGIVNIRGISNALNQELLETENGVKLNVFNLEKNRIGAIILDDYSLVNVGDKVKKTGKVLSIGISESILGRIVDPLMKPLDGLDRIPEHQYILIDSQAPGVMQRSPVNTPLQTGIKVLDALVPIGKGQRELIIGDRQTGKTSLAIDAIINQKGKDVICIYTSIGQKESKLARIVEKLRSEDCLDYCIIVDAPGSSPASLQYLAPFSATAIAEFFARKGKDVLVIYDDLSKHAVAYRELSLILNRPPGREAFPGDVFYLHSRLLERSCKLSPEFGGGTITSLPIIETLAGDISAYIPTNVISITDGQIFLETDLFNKGLRPAINPGLSVSRVGGAAQTKAMKKVAGSMKLAMAQFRELEAFSQFSSELDENTKFALDRGKKIQELLKQKNGEPVELVDQVLTFFAVNNGVFDSIQISEIRETLSRFLSFAKTQDFELDSELNSGQWPEGIEERLSKLVKAFATQ